MHLLDTKRSLEMSRRALNLMDYGWGRDNLGRTLYLAWAEALIVDKDTAKAEALYAEAQQYLPDLRYVAEEFSEFPRAHPIFEAFKRRGYSLNRRGSDPISTSQLLLAVEKSNAGGLKGLLDAGADPNLGSHRGRETPRMRAAKAGNTELVQVLLAGGAEPRLRDAGGRDAETLARDAGQEPVAALLAETRRTHPSSALVTAGKDSEGMPLTGFRYRLLQDYGQQPFGARKGGEATFSGIADGNGPGRITLVFELGFARSMNFEQAFEANERTRVFAIIEDS